MSKIRVLIVDDSALVRKMLTAVLDSNPRIEVVGAASDPFIARDMIKDLEPDVLTLDVEMPRMDGVTFLRNLMRLRPMPVVMVSTLTEKGADVTFEALEIGAVDFVAKPKIDVAHSIEQVAEAITEKVFMASTAKVRQYSEKQTTKTKRPASPSFHTTDHIVAIGASTGGTEAIREVLVNLPANAPGIVVTQHIPAAFSGPFAERLNASTEVEVCEAGDGQPILGGHVYIAPGDRHMEVVRSGARFFCRLHDAPPCNRHRPSVDVLFESVAKQVGRNAVGFLLTGMGADGAQGLLAMRNAGAITVAQDEASSVVWGMPGAAVKLDAAEKVIPLNKVADAILELQPAGAGRG